MLRRDVLRQGGAVLAFALLAPVPALAAPSVKDAARTVMRQITARERAYFRELKLHYARRHGKKDFNRKSVVRKYGTGIADIIGATIYNYRRKLAQQAKVALRTTDKKTLRRLGEKMDSRLKSFEKYLARAKRALKRKKEIIDAEIKRRKLQREQNPAKGQNQPYNRALKDESKFLGDLIKKIDSLSASVRKARKQLAAGKQTRKAPSSRMPKFYGAPLDRD